MSTEKMEPVAVIGPSGHPHLCGLPGDLNWGEKLYTASQLQAAVAAERERCAKVCDEKERSKWEILTTGGKLEGFGARDCAAAIRQLGDEQ